MLNQTKIKCFLLLNMAVLILLPSCKEETGTLGLDVLPSDELFSGTNKTSQLEVINSTLEKIRSDDADYSIVGHVKDSNTGETESSFITQVNLGEYVEKFNFSSDSADFYPDSLVLNLAYRKNHWFGDPNANHEFSVYHYTKPLSFISNYSSDMEVEGDYNPTPLATSTFSARNELPDSVWDDNEYVHQMQIKLSDDFTNKVFNLSEESLSSRDSLKKALGAFFVKSELVDTDTPGSLIRLNLLASESNMKLYYSYDVKGDDPGAVDTTINKSYTFPINKECVRINRFSHTPGDQIQFNDKEAPELVAQGMGGSYIKLDFNEVKVLNENNEPEDLIEFWENKANNEDEYYGISSVDLVFEADTLKYPKDESFYSRLPEGLIVYQVDESGTLQRPAYKYHNSNGEVADKDEWSPQFSGGELEEEKGIYRFSLAGESFRMIVENPDLRGPYYLAPPNPISNPWPVILKNDKESRTPSIRIKYVNTGKP